MASERETAVAILLRACELFVDASGRRPVEKIADLLQDEFKQAFSRERVYRLLAEARRREIFYLRVPAIEKLAGEISKKYPVDKDRIHVLNAIGHTAVAHVASDAAQFTVDRIQALGRNQERVRLGLGGGRTMMTFSRELASALRTRTGIPKLGLHAISSGFNVHEPRTAPVVFFGYFADVPTDIEYVGLFSEAVVDASNYDAIKEAFGVKESFDEKSKIDIIITSLASATDRHGSLNEVSVGYDRAKQLQEDLWVGDVAYLPYSEEGPIQIDRGKRAVTLFELEELAARVAAGRDVILVAGPCPACGEARGAALRPLLRRPELKIWSDVFLDTGAAQSVLR